MAGLVECLVIAASQLTGAWADGGLVTGLGIGAAAALWLLVTLRRPVAPRDSR